MKVRASVRRICDKCKVVRRKGVVRVICSNAKRPEVTADPKSAADVERRFKRELLLARQVTHKNVVRIHDLGEIDGIKYITMPYIEGADLATVLIKRKAAAGAARAADRPSGGLRPLAAHAAASSTGI